MRKGHVLAACVLVLATNVTRSYAQTINWVYIPPDERQVGSCYGNCGAGCSGSPDPCGSGSDRWENYVPFGKIVPDIIAGDPHCSGGVGWITWWQRYTATGRYIFRGVTSDGCRLHDSICRAAGGNFVVCFFTAVFPGSSYCSGASPALWWYDYMAIGWGTEPINVTWRSPDECPFGVEY
jgi:hypothetical protein